MVYLAVSSWLISCDVARGRTHKTGSGTDAQEWLYALSDFVLEFPSYSTVLNASVWGSAGSALAVLIVWRKRRMR